MRFRQMSDYNQDFITYTTHCTAALAKTVSQSSAATRERGLVSETPGLPSPGRKRPAHFGDPEPMAQLSNEPPSVTLLRKKVQPFSPHIP